MDRGRREPPLARDLPARQPATVGEPRYLSRIDVQVSGQAIDVEVVISHGKCVFRV